MAAGDHGTSRRGRSLICGVVTFSYGISFTMQRQYMCIKPPTACQCVRIGLSFTRVTSIYHHVHHISILFATLTIAPLPFTVIIVLLQERAPSMEDFSSDFSDVGSEEDIS
ncbi:hypothetical protein BCR34DRAFT_100382 [Clohesyomyces aquaticus]|uniref:Uncharacterized protein n=1 Tax=Clohesyomyces aquaticus TaxID=1231657 RepID=A0A1Y1YTP3_9PLEO|nr:hypothetical protein BCR34DRAFT_100382 [Clohesyomyces aquaticus]